MKLSVRVNYIINLGLLAAFGPLCTDLYLPALPHLSTELNVSTSTAQLTLTASLFGLGIGQLLFGPISDQVGRMKPLLLSLALFIMASVWCMLAPTATQLILARFLQGIAGAGGAVLSRSIARDLYTGHELTTFFAMLMMVNGLGPIVAPILGGALLSVMDWRGLFAALTAIGVALLVMARLNISESLPEGKRNPGSFGAMLSSIGSVVRHKAFIGFCLTQALMLAGMFAYIGASPFVLQRIYNMSPLGFSLCFAINGIGLIVAAQLAAGLSKKYGEFKLLKGALMFAGIISTTLLLAGVIGAPLPVFLVILFFAIACNSAICTTASSLAMQTQSSNAGGSASAVLGVAMFTFGGISVPLSGIGGTSVFTMTLTLWAAYMLAILAFFFIAGGAKPACRHHDGHQRQ
ncbi:multidrug effflux MFS transporter [Sodalis sp. RH21]|uniref:multidrug effflux MFS transporter n=1 Tax=unclassified Sodalis (in: enterobacteria) TaxID=2636512 RepID=UPI0039B6BC52